jgi:DNA-binding response OmpR family regulator
MRVLIVEDDRRLAAALRRGLREAGLTADAVFDGEDAVAAATATSYDVILLDILLPSIDGFEVARRLRKGGLHSPILVLTARGSVDDRVAGLESGADDYLAKPFEIREVVARIRALARRHLAGRTALLTAGNIALDTASHRLQVGHRPVDLTAKEFAVLEYFMLNPGRVLSHERIIENVWSYDFEGDRNLVEVYVGRLRRKITGAGAPDPFCTLRGAGYRFGIPADRVATSG